MKNTCYIAALTTSAVLLVACSVGATEQQVEEVKTPDAPFAETIVAGACLDGTGSMPPGVTDDALEALAAVVEGWAPPDPDRADGSPPIPALDLSLRGVLGGSSLAGRGELLRVRIPEVPGAISKPEPTDPGFVELIGAWRVQAAEADVAQKAASDAASAAATEIRSASWESTSSEIKGCLEALALTQTGEKPRLIVVSDLEQSDPPQVGLASFEGVDILVVHACEETEVCRAQEQTWRDALTGDDPDEPGAESVDFARPERVREAFSEFLTEVNEEED